MCSRRKCALTSSSLALPYWFNESDKALSRVEGTTWKHRPYFYRAIRKPGEAQVTQAYFSILDAKLCITLSSTILNGDITWDE